MTKDVDTEVDAQGSKGDTVAAKVVNESEVSQVHYNKKAHLRQKF